MPAFGIERIPAHLLVEREVVPPHPLPFRPILYKPRGGSAIEVCVLHRVSGIVLATCEYFALRDPLLLLSAEDCSNISEAFKCLNSDENLSFETLPEPLRETFTLGEPRADW